MNFDYKALGLKCGFEIHQQLATKAKLFCNCPTELRDDPPDVVFNRRLRPVPGETGIVDLAAMHEWLRAREFVYEGYSNSTCDVEYDEEPPHEPNQVSIDITIEVAQLLNAKVVDEIHVMRKTVIDGSNTSGFQRTAFIATDGYIETKGGKVGIPTICLEEEAARIIETTQTTARYRLNRLGIPLIEIGSSPDIHSPEQAKEAVFKVGLILRATEKVKRGIGTIRQDLNISIKNGARVEVKGVQELSLVPKIIENEVKRQVELLKIRDELKKRNVDLSKVTSDFSDLTHLLSKTQSKILKKALEKGCKILALRLIGFGGLLGREIQPGRRFGTELSDYAKVIGGVGGIIHTDELPAFGIPETEVDLIIKHVNANKNDAVVIVADSFDKAEKALKAVVDRARQAITEIPVETRRALQDGNTEYMRPLPGAARMYPETDIAPIVITPERLSAIKQKLPELPEDKMKRFVEDHGLSEELAFQMVRSKNLKFFEELIETYKVSPTIIARTLESTIPELKKENIPVENITVNHLKQIFVLVENNKLVKEGIPQLLRELALFPSKTADEILKTLKLKLITEEELEQLVQKVIDENKAIIQSKGPRAAKPLMGIIMERVQGRADGKLVSQILERKLKEA
ncbi:MAG: Glu-tRNA(Gln) amidotransferase subunit GatE [Euryarchaeota archaeon]|nr:Glu-tRNA(Gln) amidotransferase subunit GatE [Euryarchaeota archaeon]